MQEKIIYTIKDFALGFLLVAQSPKGICAIFIDDDALTLHTCLKDRFPKAYILQDDIQLENLTHKIIKFLKNPKTSIDIPLDIRGTDFQKKVWTILQKIPAGKTASYTDIANELQTPKAVRAVARACASNLLAVIIPCHRIIRKNGDLSGYRWGIKRKKKLLELESS